MMGSVPSEYFKMRAFLQQNATPRQLILSTTGSSVGSIAFNFAATKMDTAPTSRSLRRFSW